MRDPWFGGGAQAYPMGKKLWQFAFQHDLLQWSALHGNPLLRVAGLQGRVAGTSSEDISISRDNTAARINADDLAGL